MIFSLPTQGQPTLRAPRYQALNEAFRQAKHEIAVPRLAAVTVYFPTAPSAITPQFVGAAEGLIAGIPQVNVQVPASIHLSGATPIGISLTARALNCTRGNSRRNLGKP